MATAATQQGHDRLLPVLAVERAPRAIVLIGVRLILPCARRADLARRFAEHIGLDPSRRLR
jgi:hypothetical protein